MTLIEFTEDEVGAMAWGYQYPAEIRRKFVDALTPEHPESCRHTCGCTSEDECPHYCSCEDDE